MKRCGESGLGTEAGLAGKALLHAVSRAEQIECPYDVV